MSALVDIESGGDPNAKSPDGALGLYQILPATASDPGYGVKPLSTGEDVLAASEEEQRRFAEDYIRTMQSKYGSLELALAAYNAGAGNVERYGGIPPFRETQNYVKTILGGFETAKAKSKPEHEATASTTAGTDKGNRLLNSFIDLLSVTGGRILGPQSSTPAPELPDYTEGGYIPEEEQLNALLGVYQDTQRENEYQQALQNESIKGLQRNKAATESAVAELFEQALSSFSAPTSLI